jgi:hypothetical protein
VNNNGVLLIAGGSTGTAQSGNFQLTSTGATDMYIAEVGAHPNHGKKRHHRHHEGKDDDDKSHDDKDSHEGNTHGHDGESSD